MPGKLDAPLDPPPTALVANLPYNVAVPVLLHLLELLPSIRHGLVLMQAEVADRLAAPPGGRVYGGPTVKTAWYAHAERAGAVPRSVFWPVPNARLGPRAAGANRAADVARRKSTVRTSSRSSTLPLPSGARCFGQRWPHGPDP